MMWVKKYSKSYTDVKKENVWLLWVDANNWPKWDTEIKYCKIDAPFTKGTQFILKPTKGPKVKITLCEVINNKKFTSSTKFPGAMMYVEHELEETSIGLRISNTITVHGFLSFVWTNLIAKKLAASVPKHMDALVELAG